MPKLKHLVREPAKSTRAKRSVQVLFAVLDSLLITPVISYTRGRARRVRVTAAVGLVVAVFGVAGFLSFTRPAPATAAAANTINFQARLENTGGDIAADGTYNVEFNLYNVSSGGSTLWTEDYLNNASQGVTIKNGYLTVNLGSITALPTNIWGQQLWLGMTVRGTGSCAWGSCTPADSEMSPRLSLTAVPAAYALVNTNGSNSSTLTIAAPTGGNQSFVLQDQGAGGTYNICIQASSSCGFALGSGTAFLQGGNTFSGSTAGDLGTNNSGNLNFRTNGTTKLTVDTSGNLQFAQASTLNVASAASGAQLTIQAGAATSGTNVGGNLVLQGGAGASTGASGSVIVKSNTNNSTTAFQIQDASSDVVLSTDTVNQRVGIRTASPSAYLDINGAATVIGSELVTNGTFTGSAAGWTLGDCASYGSNEVTVLYDGVCSDTSVSTTISTTANHYYELSFDLATNGDHMFYYFDNNAAGLNFGPFGDGHNTLAFTTDYTGTDTIYFDSWDGFTNSGWTIDNVSIREISAPQTALKVTGYDGSTWLSLGNDLIANTAIGQLTLSANTTGYYNTATGSFALQSNTIGNENTATGAFALQSNTTGYVNAANGAHALQSNTTGRSNTATGGYSLYFNTTGQYNTANGAFALYSNTTGFSNTGLGESALYSNTTGGGNTASGSDALYRNTTGDYNTATGGGALYLNTTGSANTATGAQALANNTTGSYNVASGYNALLNLVTLSDSITATTNNGGNAKFTTGNTMGLVSGMSLTISGTTSYNGSVTVVSVDDGTHFTISTAYSTADSAGSWTGSDPNENIAVGYQAGYGSNGRFTVQGGTLVGSNAGSSLQSGGDYNTLFGYYAGNNITTGNTNLLLGKQAGFSLTTGSNNIVIGNVDVANPTGDNQLQIGNLIQGDMGAVTLLLQGSTTIDANKDLTFASGGGNLDMHLSTGTFQTGTGAISLNGNVTVASGKYLTLTGSGSRPGSPTAGMLYYDTTTNQLLQYNGSKWVSDRSPATKIVAMGTASGCSGTTPVASSSPDGADFVSTSCTSSQTTINNAISALPSGGGTVYLEEGTYIIDGTINIPSNVTLSGAGAATIIEAKNSITSNTTLISAPSTSNVSIKNLQINGNGSNNSARIVTGVGIGSTTNTTIQNVVFTSIANSTSSIGITGTSDNDLTITNNYFTGNNQAIYLQATTRLVLSDNEFTSTNNNVVQLWNGAGGIVSGNNVNGGGTGFSLSSAGSGILNVTGNTLSGLTTGVSSTWTTNLTITANNFNSNTTAISLAGSGSSFLADSAVISGNKIVASGVQKGIILGSNAKNISITNNVITTNNNYGIDIQASSVTNTYLSNNTIMRQTGTPGINDAGFGTVYANQHDDSGNLIIKSQGGGLAVGQSSASASFALQGGMRVTALPTPAAPTVTPNTTGSTTYGYKVTALDGNGETLPSPETTIANGNATPNNTVSWTPIGGAYQYRVYRTTGGATQGLLATVNGNLTSYTDNNGAASGSVPTQNLTGGIYVQGNSGFGTTPSTNVKLTVSAAGTDGGISIANNNGTGLTVTTSGGGTGVYSLNLGTGIGLRASANSSISGIFQTSNTSGTNTSATLVTEANSNQTADLLQAQNSSGASLTSISATGQLRVGATYAAMSTPSGLTLGTASGGSLAATTTYYYKVTAIDSNGGETTPSTEQSIATTGTNKKITLYWTAVTGASGYKIYRATSSGSEVYLTTVLSNYSSGSPYTDDGSITIGTATPPTSTTAYVSTNVAMSNTQLTVGGNGTPTGQVYVGGALPGNNFGSLALGTIQAITVQGRYAYAGTSTPTGGFRIIDISNPQRPQQVGTANTGGTNGVTSISVQGKYAYVLAPGGWFGTFDISDPSNPTSLGNVSVNNTSFTSPNQLSVQGKYAYVLSISSSTVQILDITNPANPVILSSIGTNTQPSSLYVSGRYVYVGNSSGGSPKLQIIDVANPMSPTSVGLVNDAGGFPYGVRVVGRYAYVVNGDNTLKIFDVSTPSSPVQTGSVSVGTDPVNLAIQGRYAYVLNKTSNTLQILDVSNPVAPFSIGTTATSSSPASLTIQGRYAYVGSSAGLQIFDLGGTYSQQLEAGGAEFGTLQVDGNEQVAGDSNIQGGLSVGQSIQAGGNLGVAGNTFLQGTLAVAGGIQGGVTVNGISTPSAPTVTTQGTTGAQTWGYEVVAVSASGNTTAASTQGTTTSANGVSTLTNSNYQQVSWSAVTGAVSYKVYRTQVAGTSPSPATTGLIGTTSSTIFNDTGLAGDSSTPPSTNTSGLLTVNGPATFNENNLNQVNIVSDLSGGARSGYLLNLSQANNASNNNSVGLLQLTNSDTASLAAVFSISQVTNGNGIDVTASGGTAYRANSVTSGTGLDINNLTSGNGISLSGNISSGNFISISDSAAGGLPASTGAFIQASSTKTLTSSSINDTGNLLNLSRANTVNNAGSTYTYSGALANLQSNCTQTAGTCTDSANILNLNQQYASASGTVLNVQNSGTGNAISISQSTNTAAINTTSPAAGTGLSIGGISSGTGISFSNSNITSGVGINFGGSAPQLTSGSLLRDNGSSVGVTNAFTGNIIDFTVSRTRTATSGTMTDSGSFLNLARNNTQNGAGGTFAITGALANLQSNCTQTAGTCTDTSNILNLNQQYANATGAVVNVQNSGTGTGIFENMTGTGNLIDLQASGTSVFTVSTAGAITLNGDVTVSSGKSLTVTAGNVAFTKGTDYSTTGLQDNVSFGNGVLFRLTGASTQTIKGIAGGTDGRRLTLVNAAAQNAILKNNNSGTAANIILTGTGSDLTLAPNASIDLVYDSGASVWRVVAAQSGAGGGGGSTSLQTAYDTSAGASPSILLSNANGGISIQDAASSSITNLLDIANNGGTTHYLTVTSSGVSTSGTLTVNGTTLSSTTLSYTGAGTVQSASGSNLTVSAQGSGNLNLSTGSGVINLQGNTTVAAGKNLTFASGSGNFDQSASSGSFQTGTGNVSLNGATTVTGTNTLTVNGGLTTLQAGLTANGGTVKLNDNSNNNTQINTGTSTGTVSIGNSAAGNVTVTTSATTNTTLTGGQVTTYAKAWGGTGSDTPRSVVRTSDGGYVVVGDTTSFGAGGDDVFIAKYDSTGTLSWNKVWGGSGTDFANAVIQTSDGGYAVTGQTGLGAGAGDSFLLKYDSTGTLSWNKVWGGTGLDMGRSVIQTSDGGYAVTGQTASFGAGSSDAFLVKYDASGTLSWNKVWGGTNFDNAYSLVQASDGGYVIAGDTTSFGAGSDDAFLVKYDASGTLSWNKVWGGTGADFAYSLARTSDGGYVIAGDTASFGAGSSDSFIAKYDSTGTLSWNKVWGGTGLDNGRSVVQTSDGGYAVAGQTASFGAGSSDSFIAKYDSTGTLSWNKTWGGTGLDYAYSLVQASDGGYAVTGRTASFGAGSDDSFIAKYDSSGTISGCSTHCASPSATTSAPSATTSAPSATTSAPSATTSAPSATSTVVDSGASAVNAVAVNGSTSISGQLTAGSTTIQGGLVIQAGANTPTALLLQNAAGMNSLAFDTTTNTLKVFDAAGSGNYALVMYTNGTAIFGASSGTTQIGTGSGSGGNINLVLTNQSDQLVASKTLTATSAYSIADFSFTRAINTGGFAVSGKVFDIEDNSTLAGGSLSPSLLYLNQNNAGATGYLIQAQTTGNTDRFKVDTSGNVDINGTYKINGTAINLTPTLQNVYDNSSSPAVITEGAGKYIKIVAGAAATTDLMRIDESNGGTNTITTTGSSGLHIIAAATSGSSGFTHNGILLDGPPSQSSNDTDTAVNVGTGWDIGLNLSSGGIQMTAQSDPAAPAASTIRVYAKDIAGKILPKWIGPSGVDTPVQPHLGFNRIAMVLPSQGTAATTIEQGIGTTFTNSGTGTLAYSNPALASTNLATSVRRARIQTTTTGTTAIGYHIPTALQVWRGNACVGGSSNTCLGGFFFTMRFNYNALNTNSRSYIGMVDSTTAPTSVDPTTATTPGKLGIGFTAFSAGSTNFQLLNNVTGTAPTSTGTGIGVNTTDLYELIVYSPPNGSTIGFRLTDISTGTQYSNTSVSSNIPTNTTFLAPTYWVANGGTAGAISIDTSGWYLESDN